MEQKTLALELLVKSGKPLGVIKLAKTEGFDSGKTEDKISEAVIYSAIVNMTGEESGCGIDSTHICAFLSQENLTAYFRKTQNTELMSDLLDALHSGTQVMMEAYAQIEPLNILGMESISSALRRFLDVPEIKKSATDLVNSGYSLVFCPHDIDSEMVEHYFPLVDKFRDLIDPNQIVEGTMKYFGEDLEDLLEYHDDFLNAALDKLAVLTDRETVSRLAYEHFGENNQKFIEAGKVDPYVKKQEAVIDTADATKTIEKAVAEFEKEKYPSYRSAIELDKKTKGKGKVYLANKMGQWLTTPGKLAHLEIVANYENGSLYDNDAAKRIIGEGIAAVSEEGNIRKLQRLMSLPEYVIDESNPKISGFVTAYKLSRITEVE
ncbi:Uncharacterised protein [uncultured archaeon]|nr:Uncharacterised protein [uncultured archaeon]